MTWFNEIHEYNVSEPNNLLTGEMFNTGIGHFTAVSINLREIKKNTKLLSILN